MTSPGERLVDTSLVHDGVPGIRLEGDLLSDRKSVV